MIETITIDDLMGKPEGGRQLADGTSVTIFKAYISSKMAELQTDDTFTFDGTVYKIHSMELSPADPEDYIKFFCRWHR